MGDTDSTTIVPKAAQPANFAKSKADILQTLQYYFGDPAYPQKLMDYTQHHAATGHLCAARSHLIETQHVPHCTTLTWL